MAELSRAAADEAVLLADAGFDALLIENMHDVPYLNGAVGPEIVAAMTAIGAAVRSAVGGPLGVQVLAGANRAALAVAHAIGAQFVRVENYVFSHVADEGLMPRAAAGPLLRYRRRIGASEIRILADVKKKHAAHALTADLSIAQVAAAAEFAGADGVIVTGGATGLPADVEELRTVRAAVRVPVLVGSGLTASTLAAYWPHADAFVVGSALKVAGVWSNPLEPARLREFVAAARELRG